jgi:hypothetical protein
MKIILELKVYHTAAAVMLSSLTTKMPEENSASLKFYVYFVKSLLSKILYRPVEAVYLPSSRLVAY